MRSRTALRTAGRSSAVAVIAGRGSWTLLTNVGTKVEAAALLAAGAVGGGLGGVGRASAAFAAATLAASIADFGYSAESARYLAASRTAGGVRLAVRGTGRRLPLALIAGLVAAAIVLKGAADPAALLLVGLLAAALFASTAGMQLLYGLSEFRRSSIASLWLRGGLAPVIVLLGHRYGFQGVLLGLVAIETLVALRYLALINRVRRGLPAGTAPEAGPSVRHLWLGVAGLTNTLINRSDAALVSTATSATAVGVYTLASQLENGVTTIAIAPGASVPTFVAGARAGGGEYRGHVVRTAKLVGALAAAGGVAVFALMLLPPVRALFAGQAPFGDFLAAVALCMVAAPASASGGVLLSAVVGEGRHRAVGVSWLTLGALSVPVLWMLAHGFGAVGAATGALCRDLILFAVGVAAWRRAGLDPSRGVPDADR